MKYFISFLIIILSCFTHFTKIHADQNISAFEGGKTKCIANGGKIIKKRALNGTELSFCEIEECYDGDDGQICDTNLYELGNYYNEIEEGEVFPNSSNYQADDTVRSYFNQKVIEIMSNLENTGYAHNKHNNFSLSPNYTEIRTEIKKTQSKYNLFLDCSGFVGYYVIQGLAKPLYNDVTPSQYQCGNRPLAADFADAIRKAPQVDKDHPEATMEDLEAGNVCWGQVKHVKNILPGDVIVYKHTNNIKSKDKNCTDGTKRYKVEGNTGHILFAHGEPYKSTKKKGNDDKYQYVVRVADSTTSKHMWDSRKLNKNKSHYTDYGKSNYYHAWRSAGKYYTVVEKCKDRTYHRDCTAHQTKWEELIRIDSTGKKMPTGLGVGRIYISVDRKSYRTKYSSKNKKADIYIGRPIRCDR